MHWRVVWHHNGFQCRDFSSRDLADRFAKETHEMIAKDQRDRLPPFLRTSAEVQIIGPTLAMLAKEACDVQNACNLSGVVRSYSEVLTALRDLPECTGNAWLHSHPVSVAFADKIASLTNIQNTDGGVIAMKAYRECARLANHDDSEPCDECSGSRWPRETHEGHCSLANVVKGE